MFERAEQFVAATSFIDNVTSEIIRPLIGLLIALSTIYFLYGILESMSYGDAKKMEDGKKHVMWGLIGLFISVSFAGIMSFVSDTVSSLVK